MAGIALRNGRNVIRRLTQRIGIYIATGVAGGALARRSRVIHPRRPESREVGMAGIALCRGWKMVSRFAKRCCAIVAAGTLPVGAGIMCIHGRCP